MGVARCKLSVWRLGWLMESVVSYDALSPAEEFNSAHSFQLNSAGLL